MDGMSLFASARSIILVESLVLIPSVGGVEIQTHQVWHLHKQVTVWAVGLEAASQVEI
jgi:hypothetical protein